MLANRSAASKSLLDLVTRADRLVLAGHPRPAAQPQANGSTVHRQKEVLLELMQAGLPAKGPEVVGGNPHFLRMAEWTPGLTVVHGSALELTCPVPLARNLHILDGEDLLGLAEEQRAGDPLALRRQRIALMDGVLALPAMPLPEALVPAPHQVLPLEAMLEHRGRLPQGNAGPVQWCACDFETGPYNFLHRRRQPKPGTSHVPVLMESARRAGRRSLVAFATPADLPELGPVLRACAALPTSAGLLLNVFFFGSPEELVSSLEHRQQASFFGDNLQSPNIRFLFGPFAAADLLEAVAGAAGSVDTCYGGVLNALAAALGVPNRIVLGADGGFDAWRGAEAVTQGVAWETIFAPAVLTRRRHKVDRSQERQLLALLGGIG